jgi:hypothetical protein
MKSMRVPWAIQLVASCAMAGAPPVGATGDASVDTPALARWRAAIGHTPRPKGGCFTATYPQIAWVETPCRDTPRLPHRPGHGVVGASGTSAGVGSTNGDILVAAGAINEAEGTFLSVATTGESDSVAGAESYSLQLNANTFYTTRCEAAPAGASSCYGWQQFVYDSDGTLSIQYWLLDWGPKGATCPAQSSQCDSKYVYTDGWCPFEYYGETDCALNSPSGSVATLTAAQLAQVSLTASLAGSHGNLLDGVTLTQPGAAAVSVTGSNEFPDLAGSWQQAEFNVFGAGNSSAANFNAGSTFVIQLSTDTGIEAAPGCTYGSLTGETSNLSIVDTTVTATDSLYPSLVFTESNATGTSPVRSCSGVLALPGGSTDVYAPASRQLTIPTLQIGWATYSHVVVTIRSVITPPSGTSANGLMDTYDPQTGLLTLQAVAAGAQTYYNVTAAISSLRSIGAVVGADRYDGSVLYVPQIEAGGKVYGDVIATVGSVVSVGGGMPAAVGDTYVATSDVLTIPAVQVGNTVHTNVVIKVGQIQSVGVTPAGP